MRGVAAPKRLQIENEWQKFQPSVRLIFDK